MILFKPREKVISTIWSDMAQWKENWSARQNSAPWSQADKVLNWGVRSGEKRVELVFCGFLFV